LPLLGVSGGAMPVSWGAEQDDGSGEPGEQDERRPRKRGGECISLGFSYSARISGVFGPVFLTISSDDHRANLAAGPHVARAGLEDDDVTGVARCGVVPAATDAGRHVLARVAARVGGDSQCERHDGEHAREAESRRDDELLHGYPSVGLVCHKDTYIIAQTQ